MLRVILAMLMASSAWAQQAQDKATKVPDQGSVATQTQAPSEAPEPQQDANAQEELNEKKPRKQPTETSSQSERVAAFWMILPEFR